MLLNSLCKYFLISQYFVISRLQNLFNHSLFVKCLDRFQFLSIVNNAAMAFLVIDSSIIIINSLGHISRSGIIRSKGTNTLKFLDKYFGRLPTHIITWTSSNLLQVKNHPFLFKDVRVSSVPSMEVC